MENKYFYISYQQFEYSSNNREPQLIKWNGNNYVHVDENVEHCPYISATIGKFKENGFDKPRSDKFQKVKPVIEELFDDYYNHALRSINSIQLCNNEFYIIENSRDWFQIEYYSEDEKNKRSLCIDFRDSIEDLWLMVHSNHGFKGRPNARKNGTPIQKEDFILYLNLTLKFLSDHNSYNIFLDSFIKDSHKLTSGDKNIEGLEFSSDKSIKSILDTLEKRKVTIEMRLIENDNDSQEDRIKLRGELEGIKYAITTVNLNK